VGEDMFNDNMINTRNNRNKSNVDDWIENSSSLDESVDFNQRMLGYYEGSLPQLDLGDFRS